MATLLPKCRSIRRRTNLSDAKLSTLIDNSYSVSRSSCASTKRSSSTMREGCSDEKLFTLVRFIGRVETIYSTLIDTAVHLPSFENPDITAVLSLHVASGVPTSLRTPFTALINAVDDCAQGTAIKQLNKIQTRYTRLCAKGLYVHAEIGLLFYLLRADHSMRRTFE